MTIVDVIHILGRVGADCPVWQPESDAVFRILLEDRTASATAAFEKDRVVNISRRSLPTHQHQHSNRQHRPWVLLHLAPCQNEPTIAPLPAPSVGRQ